MWGVSRLRAGEVETRLRCQKRDGDVLKGILGHQRGSSMGGGDGEGWWGFGVRRERHADGCAV